jgi:hypothetical protein
MGPFAALARLSAGMLILVILLGLLLLGLVLRLLFAAVALTFPLAPLLVVGLIVWLVVRALQKPERAA